MAVIRNGILGGFSGKAGTVVGYSLMGQNIMRGDAAVRTIPFTMKEQANQRKFAVSQKWLSPLTPVFRIGFEHYKPTSHGFNGAKSYNSLNAVKGLDPFCYVDPALACVSYGVLAQDPSATAVLGPDNNILFTWTTGGGAYNDRVIAVAYDMAGEYASYDTSLAKRAAGKASLPLNDNYSGTELHIYFAFVSEDRKESSTSQYLGIIMIP